MRPIAPSIGPLPYSATPLATDFADSLQNTAVTVGPVSTTRRNAFAALVVNTTGQLLEVSAVNTVWSDVHTFADVTIIYRVDGGRISTLSSFTSNGAATWLLQLAPGSHVVEIWDGYQKSGAPVEGVFTWRVRSDEPFTFNSTPTANAVCVIYGDSRTEGAYASTASAVFTSMLKANFPGRVAVEAWGGRDLYDDVVGGAFGGFGNPALLATRLGSLGRAAPTIYIVDLIDYNDWSHANETAAAYATRLADEYDRIHAGFPSAIILSVTSFITTQEAATNANGETIVDFRTAKASVWSGRSFVRGYDGKTFSTTAGIASGDSVGAHFNDNGNLAAYNGTGPAAGSNNFKAILAF